MFVLLALLVLVAPFTVSGVPTTVPFGGIATPALSYTVGQQITGVSDVKTVSFYVLAHGVGGSQVGVASISAWPVSGSPVVSTSVSLPSVAGAYQLVTVTFNVQLDPTATYIFSIAFTVTDTQYFVATKPTAGGVAGGYVEYAGSWTSGSAKDIIFGITTQNLLKVNPSTNFAQGPGGGGWGCNVITSYSAIQVDWSTLKVNTGFKDYATTVSVAAGTQAACGGYKVPYGTCANCGYSPATNAQIDLTNTNYKVNDVWVAAGYIPNGQYTSANNSQLINLYGGGDCGYELTSAAAAAGEQASIVDGGWLLQLAHI